MLHYCLTCEKIIPIQNQQDKTCPSCQKKLLYFGREEVTLSASEIFKAYDISHPFSPIQDYTGTYFTALSYTDDPQSELECDDMLAADPNNIDALFYKGLRAQSNGEAQKAILYFNKIHALDPDYNDTQARLIELYFKNKDYAKAIPHLHALLKKTPKDFALRHNLGLAYLFKQSSKQALKQFIYARKLCKNSTLQKNLETVIKQLITLLSTKKS